MKNILCFFLILAGIFTFSQRTTVDAKITYNDGHSENAKVLVATSLFDPKVMDIMSIAGNKITIEASDGKKDKILSTEIQKLDFTDLKGRERHFAKMPDYKNLVEIKYDGKAKWYKLYDKNAYDRSTTVQDYIYVGSKGYFFSILKNNQKKLKEFFADRADLFPLIDKINYNRLNEDDLYALLKKHEE